MTVESGINFIADLNENYPRKGDLIKEGDDHMRLIKSVLKTTLPGFTRTMNMSAEKLNQFNANTTITTDNIKFLSNVSIAPGMTLDLGKTSRITNVGAPVDPDDVVTKSYMLTYGAIAAYPVGSIYFATNAANPKINLGFGTWEPFAEGRCLIGVGGTTDDRGEGRNVTVNQRGGEFQHTLTTDQLPVHSHGHNLTGTTSEAGGHKHGMSTTAIRMSIHDIWGRWFMSGGSTDYTDTAGAHVHTVNLAGSIANTGSGFAHNNMQPFVGVYIWIRTA